MTFDSTHSYGTEAITIPVTLRLGNTAARTDAYLDTGATFCVFKRSLAEPLGLEVGAGEPIRLSTVTGSFEAYGHSLTLETFGYSFDVTVYFAAHEAFSRNVLGRRGWLDQVRLGVIEYE